MDGFEFESYGFTPKIKTTIVEDADLSDALLVFHVRHFLNAQNIGCSAMADWLVDLYRDYKGIIVDAHGQEIFLNTEVLFEIGHEWYRDLMKVPPLSNRLHVRREARQRWRVMLTILRACFPEEAQKWGQGMKMIKS